MRAKIRFRNRWRIQNCLRIYSNFFSSRKFINAFTLTSWLIYFLEKKILPQKTRFASQPCIASPASLYASQGSRSVDRELTRAVPLSIAPRRLWYIKKLKMHIKTSGEGNFVIITKNVPRKFSWPRVITLSFSSQNNSRFRSLFLNEKFVAKNADWNRWKSKVQLMWVPITCLAIPKVV